ncbi:MAG: hypothetical protein GEU87_14965 [Alphaproteobacteria bacterium]|nr:hypothetical protein [Alphaproteobacteria bacterium]
MGRFGDGETIVRARRLRMRPAILLTRVSAAVRRAFAMHGRRIAVLWRSFAGPGRRVRLPRRSIG